MWYIMSMCNRVQDTTILPLSFKFTQFNHINLEDDSHEQTDGVGVLAGQQLPPEGQG